MYALYLSCVLLRRPDALELEIVGLVSHLDLGARNQPWVFCKNIIRFQDIAYSIVQLLCCLSKQATATQMPLIPLWISACLSLCGLIHNLNIY